MTSAPTWVMGIAYWLHMLATIAWLGGLFALLFLVLPAVRRHIPAEYASDFLNQVQNRLQWLGWISLVVLAATGMFQMSSNPNYQGFLTITNSWAVAIFIKHILVSVMVLVTAYLTWGLLPALNRMMLRRKAGKTVDTTQMERLERQEQMLLTASLVLSILVIAFTAWARAV